MDDDWDIITVTWMQSVLAVAVTAILCEKRATCLYRHNSPANCFMICAADPCQRSSQELEWLMFGMDGLALPLGRSPRFGIIEQHVHDRGQIGHCCIVHRKDHNMPLLGGSSSPK